MLSQVFAQCGKFPTTASRRSLGRVSVPVWLIILSDQLLIIALIVAVVKRKAKNATTDTTTPACLGNWKIIIPSFLKPLMVSQNKEKKRNKDNRFLATTKMKATVQRRAAGFFRKFFASLRKQR
nr:putative cytochrome C biosynthesis protein [Ipomoea batatas]